MDEESLRSEIADLFEQAQQSVVDRAEAYMIWRRERQREQSRENSRNFRQRAKLERKHRIAKRKREIALRDARAPSPALFLCECGAEAIVADVGGKIGLRCATSCKPPWLPDRGEFKRGAPSPTSVIYAQQCKLIDHASELLEVVRSKHELGWLTPRQFGWKGFMAADMLAVLVRRGQVERKQIGSVGTRPTYAYRAKTVQEPCERLAVDAAEKRAEKIKSCLQCNGPGPSCPRSWCSSWYSGSSSAGSAA